MPVVIGMLMLMGIVTKNAIMLVDFAVEEIGQRHAAPGGDDRAGPQARPADRDDDDRHGGGHGPAALGWATAARFRSPMAIAVIGGLIVSTVLSLVFVPAVFTVMDDVGALCGGVRVAAGAEGEAGWRAEEGARRADPRRGADAGGIALRL